MKSVGRWFKSVGLWSLVAEGIWLILAYTILSPQIALENWELINKVMSLQALLLGLVFGTIWWHEVCQKQGD